MSRSRLLKIILSSSILICYVAFFSSTLLAYSIGPSTATTATNVANWTNWTASQLSSKDDQRATTNQTAATGTLSGFDFSGIPAGSIIDGIVVHIQASESHILADGYLVTHLSWDNGTSYTQEKRTPPSGELPTSDTDYDVGGSTDNWGHSWTVSEVTSTFKVKIWGYCASTSRATRADYVAVTVHYSVVDVSSYTAGTPTVPPISVDKPSTGNCLGTFKFDGGGTISQITITEYGTCDAANDLENVKLFKDDGDGNWESGDDTTQLDSTTTFNASNKATFSSLNLTAGSTCYVHVVLDVNSNATDGETVGIELYQNDIVCTSTTTASSWPVQLGTSIIGSVVTVSEYSVGTPSAPWTYVSQGSENNLLGTFKFDGSGTVTTITIHEYGSCDADDDLENVKLYEDDGDGNWEPVSDTTQLGSSTSFNSSDEATFSGLSLSASTSTYVHLVADIKTNATLTQTVGVDITAANKVTLISGIVTASSWPVQLGTTEISGYFIYVADTGNNRIVKRLASDLSYVVKIGTYGAGNDQFNAPYGIAADKDYIYVADRNNNRVVRRNKTDLSYVDQVTSANGSNLNAPRGVASDGTYVYIGDYANHRVLKLNRSDLSFVAQVGETGVSGTDNDHFNSPSGITFDETYLYIADSLNHRIMKRKISDLSYVDKVGSQGTGNDQFNKCYGMAVYSGYLFVGDEINHRVVKRRTSNLSYVAQQGASPPGTSGTGDGEFTNTKNLATDDTYVYVCDGNNHRIQKLNQSDLSFVSKIGGLTAGNGNDQFNYPRGMAHDTLPEHTTVSDYTGGTPTVPPSTVDKGTMGNCLGTFKFGGAGTVSQITLTEYGTCNAGNDLDNVKLFQDDGDGNWESGQDTIQLGSTTTFSGPSSTATFSGLSLATGATCYVHVLLDVKDTATYGQTIGLKILQSSDVTSTKEVTAISWPVQLGTSTISPPQITVSKYAAGTPTVPPSSVNPPTTNTCLGTFRFDGIGTISQITLSEYGTCDADSVLDNVKLFQDDGDGNWETSQDTTQLGSTTTFNASNKATFSSLSLGASATCYAHVVLDVKDNAIDGQTIAIELYQNDIVCTSTTTASSWPVQLGTSDIQVVTTKSFQDGVYPDAGYSGTRDTYINSLNPTTNYGNSTKLNFDGDNPEASVVIKWDISSIPAGSTVNSATITFTNAVDTSAEYELYEMKRDWVEGNGTSGSGADWSTYDGSTNWGTAGAQSTTTDRGTAVLGTIQLPNAPGQPYNISLNSNGIALIQAWVNGTKANYGIIIQDYVPTDGGDVYSRECSTTTYRPKLAIKYSPAQTNVSTYTGGTPTVPPSSLNKGTSGNCLGTFKFGGAGTVSQITLTEYGTCDAANDLENVKLFKDDGDGDWELSQDTTQLGSTTTFSGASSTATFSGLSLTAGATTYVHVILDVKDTATVAQTIGIEISQASDVTSTKTVTASSWPVQLGTSSIGPIVIVSKHTGGTPTVPPSKVSRPTTGNCLGTFRFDGSGTISQIIITEYGTCDADGHLENVKLFKDDGDGNWESGQDTTQLGSTTTFNASNKATFSSLSLAAGATCYAHVVLDVNSSAIEGQTVGIELYQDDIVCTSTTTASSWPVQLGTSSIGVEVVVSNYTGGTPTVPPASISPPSTHTCLGTFKFDGSGTISQITLSEYGTCDADSHLENVKLFQDDGDGNWETSQDTTQLGSTTTFNASNKATFSSLSLTAGSTCYVHVVLDVKSNVTDGQTVGIELYQNDIVCTSTTTASSWPVQLGTSTVTVAAGWTAYNDCGNDGSIATYGSPGNVTNFGGEFAPTSGTLIKYSDGTGTGVSLAYSGTGLLEGAGAEETHGPAPVYAPSGDAAAEFGTKINLAKISYAPTGSTMTVTLSGVSTTKTYTLVVLGMRGNNTYNRWSSYTISGISSATNSSSTGIPEADRTGYTTKYNAGDNWNNGYVAKWTNIVPSGTTITLTITGVAYGAYAADKGYLSAIKLVEEGLGNTTVSNYTSGSPPVPPSTVDKGTTGNCLGTFKFGGAGTVSQITLTEYGTCDAPNDLENVKLFKDDGDGNWESSQDTTQLGSTTTFSGASSTATFSGFNLTAGATTYVHVVLDVKSTASYDDTIGIEISQSSDVTSTKSVAAYSWPVQLGTSNITPPSYTILIHCDSRPGNAADGEAQLIVDFNQADNQMESGWALTAVQNIGDVDPITSAGGSQNVDGAYNASELKTVYDLPHFFAVGNHEVELDQDMTDVRAKYSGYPAWNLQAGPTGSASTTYSYDVGDIHVAVINEYWDGASNDAYFKYGGGDGAYIHDNLFSWLKSNLRASTKPYKIVIGHEPGYPVVNHIGNSLDEDTNNRDKFFNLLRTERVIAYWPGHDHHYHLAEHDGVFEADAGVTGCMVGGGNDNFATLGYAHSDSSGFKIRMAREDPTWASPTVVTKTRSDLENQVMVNTADGAGTRCSYFIDYTAVDESNPNWSGNQSSKWWVNAFSTTTATGWSNGELSLGYDTTLAWPWMNTTINNKNGVYGTFIRVPFTCYDKSSYSSMKLQVDYDDAVTVWLNGTQIHKTANSPDVGADDIWDKTASSVHTADGDADKNPDYTNGTFDVTSYISSLNEGSNVLAIGNWNDATGSDDLAAGIKLCLTKEVTTTNLSGYQAGTPPAPPSYVNTLSTGNCLGTFKFGGVGTVSQITITEYGTCDAPNDLENVKLFKDDGDGNWELGADTTQLGSTTTFSGSSSTATFSGFSLVACSTCYAHVILDVKSTASHNSTVGIQITQASDVTSTKSVSASSWPVRLSTSTIKDATPPEAVTTLSALTWTSQGEIKLSWTAPGDDGWNNDFDPGSEFDVRYSTTASESPAISTTTFASASSVSQFSPIPTPVTALWPYSMTVTGLTPGVTYYFAMRTGDEVPNWSGLSNGATTWAQTIGDTTPPAAITDLTGLCDSDTGDVTLSWSTPGDDGWTNTLLEGSRYRIDYSTYSIEWSTGNYKVEISTSGVAPHTQVSHTITGLTGDTTRYFQIWTRDEIPTNWSGLSNGATVWVNPVLSVTIEPSTRPFGEVPANQSAVLTNEFTVRNTGNITQKYQLRLTDVPTGWTAKNVAGEPGWEEVKILGLFTTQSPLETTHFNDNPPNSGDGDIVRTTTDDEATSTNFAISTEGVEVKGYNVTVGGIRYLWFRFDAPSGTSITTEQFLTVTVTAIQQ